MTKVKAERGRFSSSKKMEAVPCVLRDEDLDVVSREVRITAARFSAVGDLTMRNEVLREGLRRAKEALPLALRRSAS